MKSLLVRLTALTMLLALAAFAQQQPKSPYAQPKMASGSPATNANSNADNAPQQPAAAPADNANVEPAIGLGDLLKVTVMGAPDYDQELRVSGNGDVSLALVGGVHVAGLTTEEAAQVIRKRLMDGGFFSDPQVTVLEKEYATQGVSVLGEVQKPGVYPIVGPRRLFDVISLAGGTTPKAGQAVSITHRNQPEKVETVNFSKDPQKNLLANVQVMPGDTVVVSKAGIVYVVGDVRQPTGVIMDNGGNLTVLQAIAMAAGVNSDAALTKSRIIRSTAHGPQEIPINLKKIMAAKGSDVPLVADDILFVPGSAAKNAVGRSVDTAVRLATSIVAYRAVY